MTSFPLIISFYTTNTLYRLEIQNLIASCEAFGLETSIDGIESFGSWELNCAYKPFFILEKLKTHRRAVLWVDADGVFLQKPSFLKVFEADFAVRINSSCPLDHPSRVISSTVFANYTEGAMTVLRSWMRESECELCREGRQREFWDQEALRDAIAKNHTADVRALPLTYAKIFDHPEDQKIADTIIIEHYQASRRLKNAEKWTFS
ncbi:MAG: hypothetical protein ACM3JI_06015 [Anaerolineae bacterium]